MSDENVPKLRLKPKLAADPIVIPPPPSSVAPAPVSLPPSPGNGEGKAFRLKPKLTPVPPPEDARISPLGSGGKSAELPTEIGAFALPPSGEALQEPAPESDKPAGKFTLRPKATATAGEVPAIASDFPPLPTEIPAPASQDLIPPPVFIDPEQQIGEVPMAVPRSLTSRPFPPPPGKFPPPPAGGKRPLPPWSQSKTSARGGKKNFAKIGGALVFAVIVLGGAFFAYKKFTGSAAAKVTITPKAQEPATPAPVEPKSEVVAPAEETAAVTAPVPEKMVPKEPAPKPVEVFEAPPASAAFKAWVDNLRVGGVRAGAETRVFIGGTAYAPGEVVNPQLGIVFDSYDAETRHLIFKDKTGAIVRRRN